jgi:hypothetical protein
LLKKLGVLEGVDHGRSSFAQEGEDVLLWRLLDGRHDVPGTYVDVGSNHPWKHSNTAFFYLKGWSGVAIDPNPDFAALFATERPRDVFLNIGISDFAGKLVYHRFAESLYNTFSVENALDLVKRGIQSPPQKVTVEVLKLGTALQPIWPAGKALDLLSIDAEGLDEKIVLTHDFARYPARFIFVEFESSVIRNGLSEPIVESLEAKGYLFVSKFLKSALFVHGSAAGELHLV